MTNRELVAQFAGVPEWDLQSITNRPWDWVFWYEDHEWEVYTTWKGETFVRQVF